MTRVVVPNTTYTLSSASPSPSPSPSPSASPLLRLTPDIRLRLYRYLGLTSWDGRPYEFDLRGGRVSGRRFARCPPEPIDFYGLLISCRTIYTEAAALLYSTNSFVVHHNAPGQLPGLQALGALTEPSRRSLSRLKVVLCEAACHNRCHNRVLEYGYSGSYCCQGPDPDGECSDSHIHQAPLLSDGCTRSTAADDVRRAWHSAATQLFAHMAAGRLALALVCDINPQHPLALQLAECILAPLLLLPRSYLPECRIRLAKTPDGGPLQKLAQDAVVHACGLLAPVPYARAASSEQAEQPLGAAATATLTNLPRELRVRILEYTDLVAPRKQVAWSRQHRAYVLLRLRRTRIPPFQDEEELYDSQFSECYRGRPEGCFCRRRHTAFSSHTQCTCWAPPGPSLFLVCRTLTQEAHYVFFSRNRFIIHDYQTQERWRVPDPSSSTSLPSYPFDRFAVSEFLHNIIPASALSHLRFLELVFPPYPAATWPGPDHPATQDWHATVAWLRDRHRLCLPALTLRVMVMDESNGMRGSEYEATAEEAKAVLIAYIKILVWPLRGLAAEPLGLARFYASFRYPQLGPRRYRPSIMPGPWYDPFLRKRDLKERLERYVMGSRYESLYADGRTEPMPSDWDHMSFDWRKIATPPVELEDF
ncbi:uncharacterized protein C8A04DRAFT_14835 [Dichotomopilus funicola]|uniref:F-box domain-containing protein n=1 Tax=Dichotomopilus funicola TaxID=1934379 RepID=A0AAN6UWT6_9PEZI|nr:hypothetical protein C8A04DRAFT_14835 [Dichotomopilus funicola]